MLCMNDTLDEEDVLIGLWRSRRYSLCPKFLIMNEGANANKTQFNYTNQYLYFWKPDTHKRYGSLL